MILYNRKDMFKAKAGLWETFEAIKQNPMDLNLVMVHIANLTEIVHAIVDRMEDETYND